MIVLWNKSRTLLGATLSTAFVSSSSVHQTQASGKCTSPTFLVASLGIAFTTIVPAACTRSHIPSGVPRSLKPSIHFHKFD
ncbi:hypothetical protein BDR04DRAFT_578751 [Suillus decipiens]|nr:hypothetical protein BDR04DRAFT_578751 [Suillus decipiens]